MIPQQNLLASDGTMVSQDLGTEVSVLHLFLALIAAAMPRPKGQSQERERVCGVRTRRVARCREPAGSKGGAARRDAVGGGWTGDPPRGGSFSFGLDLDLDGRCCRGPAHEKKRFSAPARLPRPARPRALAATRQGGSPSVRPGPVGLVAARICREQLRAKRKATARKSWRGGVQRGVAVAVAPMDMDGCPPARQETSSRRTPFPSKQPQLPPPPGRRGCELAFRRQTASRARPGAAL
jgi:hypothetical protein